MRSTMRRGQGSASDLPITVESGEYRAGKWRASRGTLGLSMVWRRRIALAVLLLLIVCGTAAIVPRTLLCGLRMSGCDGQSVMTLLDGFAGVAASRRPASYAALSKLVIVAGHAIYVGRNWEPMALRNESGWVLERFQKGQVATFLSHIERGVKMTQNDSNTLLLFSGGQTRGGAGPRSEGATYWLAADAHKWYGGGGVRERASTEEYARDSFENLLFSVCRFRQLTGRYPLSISMVSFGFKRARFVDVHRRALRYPGYAFHFVGVDPPGTDESLKAGEMRNSLGPFVDDPHGCNKEVLREKKVIRNPFLRYFPYPQGCPELQGLFRHCGTKLYEGALPWDDVVGTESRENDGDV